LTHDGGTTWRKVLDAPAKGESMFFSKDTSSIFCATCEPFGLFVSKDHSETWNCCTIKDTSHKNSIVCSLYGIQTRGHTRLIIGCAPPSLLVTDDTGTTFKTIPIGLPQGDGEVPQIAPGYDSSELYVCIAFSNTIGEGGIYHNIDAGSTWHRIESPASLWCVLADKFKRGKIWVGQYGTFDSHYPNASILSNEEGYWSSYGSAGGKLNWMLRYSPDRRSIILASENGLFKSFVAGFE
jgi:hypothetical protein